MKTLLHRKCIAFLLAFMVVFGFTACELDSLVPEDEQDEQDEQQEAIFDPESAEFRFLGTWERAPEYGDDEWDPIPEGQYVRWIFNIDGTAAYESRLAPWGDDEVEEIKKEYDSFQIEGDALYLISEGDTEKHRVTIANSGTQGLLFIGYDYQGATFSPVPYLYQGDYTLGDYSEEGTGGDGGVNVWIDG